jgi:hypothetical protein
MKLLTTGEIAKQLHSDRDKVSYALRKLDITPSGIAGNTRVYSETALVAIEEFLNRRSQKESKQNPQRIDSGNVKNICPCDQVGRNYE